MLRDRILDEIKRVEADFDVKVCYAVESGSRAWGFPSKNSDYDVRFIYVHRKDWYLSIDEKKDVIELPINDLLDINGWELRKALKLFRKSNPPLMEWIHSQNVYYQAFSLVYKLRALEDQVFSPKSAIYHYLQMAQRNYRDFHHRDKVKIKKYFYILRPILACKWIEKHLTVPPVKIQVLLEEIVENDPLKQEIHLLLKRKAQGNEIEFEPKIAVINDFIERELLQIETFIQSLNHSNKGDITVLLDCLFREILEEVWG